MPEKKIITRSRLAHRFWILNKCSKSAAEQAVESLFDILTRTLRDGDTLQITGSGTFQPVVHAARQGRHPATGALFTAPARHRIKFTASKNLLKSDTP